MGWPWGAHLQGVVSAPAAAARELASGLARLVASTAKGGGDDNWKGRACRATARVRRSWPRAPATHNLKTAGLTPDGCSVPPSPRRTARHERPPDQGGPAAAGEHRPPAGRRTLGGHLEQDGFTGPRYDLFVEELVRYGISVLRGWMHSGYIFDLVAQRGFNLNPHELDLEDLATDSDLREELATMTVARALPRFRQQALVDKGWTSEGGASITTYFMGACVRLPQRIPPPQGQRGPPAPRPTPGKGALQPTRQHSQRCPGSPGQPERPGRTGGRSPTHACKPSSR